MKGSNRSRMTEMGYSSSLLSFSLFFSFIIIFFFFRFLARDRDQGLGPREESG